MRNRSEIILVEKVEWDNKGSEMFVTCQIQNGIFSHKSMLVLPGNEINKLLCDLQKQHIDIDINDCLKIEQWDEDEVHYVFEVNAFENKSFLYEPVSIEENLKQIRA